MINMRFVMHKSIPKYLPDAVPGRTTVQRRMDMDTIHPF